MCKDMEWPRKVLRYGKENFRHCATIFGSVRFFVKKIQFFGTAAPARDNYSTAA